MKTTRTYFFSSFRSVSMLCGHCHELGCFSRHDKTVDDFKLSLKKAQSGRYTHILLGCSLLSHSNITSWLEEIILSGFTPQLVIGPQTLRFELKRLRELKARFSQLELVTFFRQPKEIAVYLNEDILGPLVWILSAHILDLKESTLLQKHQERLFFMAPIGKAFSSTYATKKLSQHIRLLQDKGFKVFPLPGLDLFNPRTPEDLELEPVAEELVTKQQVKKLNPQLSVIIPAYNNQNTLHNVLRHLELQTLPPEQFEVIVVDDGSTDQTLQNCLRFAELRPNFQLTALHFSRPRERWMGDHQFRAGIARNAGVKLARAENILFLDGDIIVGPALLNNILQDLKTHDVVQACRWQLQSRLHATHCNWNDLHLDEDVDPDFNPFWTQFQNQQENWNDKTDKWRYVSTFCLSLRKSLFLQAGWFCKSYSSYGFEDTHLGYRLAKLGARFTKSTDAVYHLPTDPERSEYQLKSTTRHELLEETADLFFRSELDLTIYETLKTANILESARTPIWQRLIPW